MASGGKLRLAGVGYVKGAGFFLSSVRRRTAICLTQLAVRAILVSRADWA
jgi:hypothetical protein